MSLLNQWIRVYFNDNGTLTDYSLKAQNDDTFAFPFVAADDFLYIAQDYPFNNFFVELGVANTLASTIQVQTWASNQWVDVVNVLDGTESSGASFGQDGVVQFIPDRDDSWDFVSDTTEEPAAMGLSSIELYDKFWLRVKFSADLDLTTTIKKIGYAFCNDRQLKQIDPEIDNYLTSWDASKTDWVEQIMLASEHLVLDFRGRNLIVHPGQILRFEDISLATAYKTLEIIYNKLGPGFEFQKNNAVEQYDKLTRVARFTFDSGADARADAGDLHSTVGRAVR